MSVEVERDALLDALRRVVDVVAAKNTIPVLGNLLLLAEDAKLVIVGTDLDRQASAVIGAAGTLRTTADAQKILAAVASLRPGRLQINDTGASQIVFQQGRARRTLTTLAAIDFPRITRPVQMSEFVVPVNWLSRLLDTSSLAQEAESGTRSFLKGVFLHVDDGALRAVGLDGFRLIRSEMPAPAGAIGMPDIIVPGKAVTLLRKLFSKAEGDVTVSVSSKMAEFSIGDASIITKLVDGRYPDYQAIIPAPGQYKLSIARDSLRDALGSVAAIVSAEGTTKSRYVNFEIGDGDNNAVSAKDSTGAVAEEPLDVFATGGPISFAINFQWLMAIAGLFAEHGSLTMSLADEKAPMLITCDKDPDLVAVIKPLGI